MKKILLNNSLAIIILSLTLSFHSIGFAADASAEEASDIKATQGDADHYQIIVDNQSSAHFECLLIQSDISRLRIVSRAISYYLSGERKACPSKTVTPIIFSETPEAGDINGHISFALIDLSAWASFGKSSKDVFTQAGETAVKATVFGGGVCAIGLDPAAALPLLPVATASVLSIQDSAIETTTKLGEAAKKYPVGRHAFELTESTPMVRFVITDGDEESGERFNIENITE